MESWQFHIPSSRVVVYRGAFDYNDKSSYNSIDTINNSGDGMDCSDIDATTAALPGLSTRTPNELKKKAKTTLSSLTSASDVKQSSVAPVVRSVIWRNVEDHHYNNQIELFVPNSRASASATATVSPASTTVSSSIRPARSSSSPSPQHTLDGISESLRAVFGAAAHYRITCSLVQMFTPDFITRFIKHGFMALSVATPVDHCNTIAITPRGQLHMSVDRDTYEQLGITGHATKFKPYNERYNISIDLLSPTFSAGNKVYDRLCWCVSPDRIKPITLLASYSPPHGELCEWPSSLSVENVTVGMDAVHSFIDIMIPSLEVLETKTLASLSPVRRDNKHPSSGDKNDNGSDEEIAIMSETLDYLGAIAVRATSMLTMSMADDALATNAFVSTFGFPHLTFPLTAACGASHRYRGFFSPRTVTSCIQYARSLVDSGRHPWCAVMVWGFVDTPVSWANHEHDVDVTGVGHNDYTIVILPHHRYIMYLQISARDQTH